MESIQNEKNKSRTWKLIDARVYGEKKKGIARYDN